MPITIEKARLNIWNAGGFAVGIAVTAFGWGVVYNTMGNANDERKREIATLSEVVKDIKSDLPAITQLQFQMTRATEQISESKASIQSTNERMDRIVESFGGKLDVLTDGMNKIATRVEVISSQIGGDVKPQRTRFTNSNIGKDQKL